MLQNSSQPAESPAPDIAAAPGLAHNWIQVWIKAVTQPKVEAYEEIANDSTLTPRRVFNWIFASAFLSFLIYFIMLYQATKADLKPGEEMTSDSAFYCGSFLGVIISGLIAVLILIIGAKFQRTIAKLLGGQGNYRKLVVTHAALSAPLFPLFFLPNAIVVVSKGDYVFLYAISLAVLAYGIYLSTVAIKAINHLSWGKAAIPPILWTGICVILSVAYTIAQIS